MKLTICNSKSISKIRQFKGIWVLVDNNFLDYENLYKKLDSATQITITKQFQKNVNELRNQYKDWVDVNLSLDNHISRLLSPVSKNPFLDFYRESMWVITICKILNLNNENILVITQSSGVMKTLRKYANENNYGINCIGRYNFLCNTILRNLKSIAVLLYDLLTYITRIFLSKCILGKKYISYLKGVNILIDTFVLPNDLLQSGIFKNRYFPGLAEWYKNKNYNIAYYPIFTRISLLKITNQYKAISKSKYLFVLPEFFLQISDLYICLWYCIKYSIKNVKLIKPKFLGVDMTYLAYSQRIESAMANFTTLVALKTPNKMRSGGITPRILIDWYENQAIDQATYIGFKSAYPNCEVIACRPYALYSRNLLSYQVTTLEVLNGLAPKEQWVGGRLWLDLSSRYDNVGKYTVMPNLRNGYLYDSKPDKYDGDDLVLLLPYSLNDALFILNCISQLFEELAPLFPKISIKAHPATSIKILKNKINKKSLLHKSSIISWDSDVSVNELLNSARIVISSGSSTSIEAVVKGVPVIFMLSHHEIDLCPLEYLDKRMYEIAFDSKELMDKIRKWVPIHPLKREIRLKIGYSILHESYEQTNTDNMNMFNFEILVPETQINQLNE